MGLKPVFYILAVAGFCVLQTDWASGLECYHCADTGGKSDCQDYNALKKSDDKEGGLKRNCSNTEYCMIEKFVKQVPGVHGISCYKCHGTSGEDSACQYNMKGLMDSAGGNGDMVKNCTNHKYCLIETFDQPSGMFSFIRDCSNNDSYSFALVYPVTLKLPPNSTDVMANRTVCGREKTGVFKVCVHLCDFDFCNGPDVTSSTDRLRQTFVLPQMFLILGFLSVIT